MVNVGEKAGDPEYYQVVVKSSEDNDDNFDVVGKYLREADAIHDAKIKRGTHNRFRKWSQEYYGKKPPPYSTLDNPTVTPSRRKTEPVVYIVIEKIYSTASKFPLGEKISRKFEQVFIATVISFNATSKLYRILYDDGDDEDMDASEIQKQIVKADSDITGEASRSASRKRLRKTALYAVGTEIRKDFDGVFYSGKVTLYDPESGFYKIRYEDGDEEEMDDFDISLYVVSTKNCTGKSDAVDARRKTKKSRGSSSATDAKHEETTFGKGDANHMGNSLSNKHTKDRVSLRGIVSPDNDLDIDVESRLIAGEETTELENQSETKTSTNGSTPEQREIRRSGRKFGEVAQSTKEIADSIEMDFFARNTCRLAGGQQHSAKEYGIDWESNVLNSYFFLIKRLSDRNYAMRGFCIDGDGVQYTSYVKEMNERSVRAIMFLPQTSLDDHAKDPTIVDACHLDMVHPKNGDSFLEDHNMLAAVTEETECIFLNGYQDGGPSNLSEKKVNPNTLVEMINKCKNSLKCFALTECVISNEVLEALASCEHLRGITLTGTSSGSIEDCNPANDVGMEGVLKSCRNLRWVYLAHSCDYFRGMCWNALDNSETCPNLEFLWVSCYYHTQERHHVTYGDHDVIRRALTNRASNLKICMINCDKHLKSRFIPGGANETDRLEGDPE